MLALFYRKCVYIAQGRYLHVLLNAHTDEAAQLKVGFLQGGILHGQVRVEVRLAIVHQHEELLPLRLR